MILPGGKRLEQSVYLIFENKENKLIFKFADNIYKLRAVLFKKKTFEILIYSNSSIIILMHT